MKYLKNYENYKDNKFLLNVNENLFDKIEKMVAGKSDKGKIIKQILDKNDIKEQGSSGEVNMRGGTDDGKSLSNPFDYIKWNKVANINSENTVILTDEKAKKLQVPNTIEFLCIMEKENIDENFTWGLIPHSSVLKIDYNLSNESELTEKDDNADPVKSDLFKTLPAKGSCKVMCFHPYSDLTLPTMDQSDIVKVIKRWVDLYIDQREKYDWIQIFENKGEMMGKF